MQADDHAVEEILAEGRRFMVPLYQRNYQWHDTQLIPFWEDVEAKAIEVLEDESRFQHYMGALILAPIGEAAQIGVTPRVQVVDGQQRLTTFQLFLAALREVARKHKCDDVADHVGDYLFNKLKSKDTDKLTRFKLTPTPSDQELFHNIVEEKYSTIRSRFGICYWGGRVPKNTPYRALRAYEEFYGLIDHFAQFGSAEMSEDDEADGKTPAIRDETDTSEAVQERLEAMLTALLNRMKLVVITLGEDDDAQVIFETLNSKGEPLLAMDLVRNNIFYRAEREKHPCWKSSPDPAFFPFFPGSVFGCPGPFHSVPHRGCRQGTPEAPAGETPAGPKVIRFRAGPRRSVRVSGGGHRRPVLPHPPVAEKGVGGHDQPAHDCHEGDPVWPAPLPEPLVQLPQVRGATAGRHRRHVDDVPRPPPSTADVAPAPDGPAVAGEGGHAQQGGGLPVADGAQLRHPRDQGRRGDGADARHRGQDAVAVGELRRSGDRHADPPLKGRDGGVDILEDPADLRAGRPRADLRQDGPQLGPLVHEPVAEHQHVAELVDGGGGRLRGLHVRERGPEGRQYPGVHPVRPPKGAGGLREVPGLAGVHHEGGETPGVQRLQQRPVHAPRRLHDGLHGAALPEEAGDPAEAVAVVGGREVPSVDVDVECTLAYVDSGDYGCHALPLLSSR